MASHKNSFRPRSRRPEAISGVLDSALGHLHLEKKLQEYAAFPHWPEIVGAEIAAIAVPEKLIRGKILAVRVADPVWAQELSMQKQQLLDKINNFGQGAVIEEIRFITKK